MVLAAYLLYIADGDSSIPACQDRLSVKTTAAVMIYRNMIYYVARAAAPLASSTSVAFLPQELQPSLEMAHSSDRRCAALRQIDRLPRHGRVQDARRSYCYLDRFVF